ncbi:MAG: hypothetical protein H6R30_420 [Methanomicrobia archaeon]|nr:hypothetical protein [Methanomicrobia archaeon]
MKFRTDRRLLMMVVPTFIHVDRRAGGKCVVLGSPGIPDGYLPGEPAMH